MKKLSIVLSALLFVLSLCIVTIRPEVSAVSFDSELPELLVTITHAYSITKPEYTAAMFSDAYVERVEPIMLYSYTEIPDTLYEKENFKDILALVLNENGLKNKTEAMELIAQLPFVEHVVPNRVVELDLEPTFIPGDADLDGKVTAADARLALRASVSLEKEIRPGTVRFFACDVNGDGSIRASDARTILRMAVGLE